MVSGNKNAGGKSPSSMIWPESLISSHLKPIFSYGKKGDFPASLPQVTNAASGCRESVGERYNSSKPHPSDPWLGAWWEKTPAKNGGIDHDL